MKGKGLFKMSHIEHLPCSVVPKSVWKRGSKSGNLSTMIAAAPLRLQCPIPPGNRHMKIVFIVLSILRPPLPIHRSALRQCGLEHPTC